MPYRARTRWRWCRFSASPPRSSSASATATPTPDGGRREPCGAVSSSTAVPCTTGCAPSTPGRRRWPRSWTGCAAGRFATPGSWPPRCAASQPVPGVAELTPEDPADASATDLMAYQADDVQRLRAGRYVDDQARVMLMAANTGVVTAQSGLERVRNQPVPIHYDMFIRAMAWFFGIMVFNRLDAASHHVASIVIGVLVMALFVIAERVGHFIEEPMSNTVFDLPMYRFCALVTGNLLGADIRSRQPRESVTSDGVDMIRSGGPAGPFKVVGVVAWQLRYDLLAILVVAAVMVWLSDVVSFSRSPPRSSRCSVSSSRSSSASATATPTTGGGRPAPSGARSSQLPGPQQRADSHRRHLAGHGRRAWTGCAADRSGTPGSWPPSCVACQRCRGRRADPRGPGGRRRQRPAESAGRRHA